MSHKTLLSSASVVGAYATIMFTLKGLALAGRLLSIEADDKISNAVSAGL